jgi:hypothetical protein
LWREPLKKVVAISRVVDGCPYFWVVMEVVMIGTARLW